MKMSFIASQLVGESITEEWIKNYKVNSKLNRVDNAATSSVHQINNEQVKQSHEKVERANTSSERDGSVSYNTW